MGVSRRLVPEALSVDRPGWRWGGGWTGHDMPLGQKGSDSSPGLGAASMLALS